MPPCPADTLTVVQKSEAKIARAQEFPEPWCSLISGQGDDWGPDLFIGRDDLIGQGIGTYVVRTALADLVLSQGDARRCVVGPSPENSQAIRCYEKCGFKHARTAAAESGKEEYVMVVGRPSRGVDQRSGRPRA